MLQLHDLNTLPEWLEDTMKEGHLALRQRLLRDRLPLTYYEDAFGRRFYVNEDGYVLHALDVDGSRMTASPTLQVKGEAHHLNALVKQYDKADRLELGLHMHREALGTAKDVPEPVDFKTALGAILAYWRPHTYKHSGFFNEQVTLFNDAGTPIVTALEEGVVGGEEDEQIHAVLYAADSKDLADEYNLRRIMRMVYGDFSVLPREWFDGNVKTNERSE